MSTEILVIREKDLFSSILIERGFSVTNFPLIKTEPFADLTQLENCLAKNETFDGIFLTSARATEIVLAKLSEMRKTFRGKFFVLGKRSDDLLKKNGYKTFSSDKATTAEELLKSIPEKELRNKKFLFPRGNRSLRVVPEMLRGVSEVVEAIVYKTTEIETNDAELLEIKEKFSREKITAVCFFSPSGVESFLNKFENFAQGNIKIAAIGKTSAQRITENNLRADFVSASSSADKFAFELIDYLRN